MWDRTGLHTLLCMRFPPLEWQWSAILALKNQHNFLRKKTWKRWTERSATVELAVRGYKLLNAAVDGTTPTTVPGHGDVGTDKLRLGVKSDHFAVV